jgi:hypothetical protein
MKGTCDWNLVALFCTGNHPESNWRMRHFIVNFSPLSFRKGGAQTRNVRRSVCSWLFNLWINWLAGTKCSITVIAAIWCLVFLMAFRRVRKIAKTSLSLVISPSVRPFIYLSASKSPASSRRIFMKFDYLKISRKSVDKILVWLKPNKSNTRWFKYDRDWLCVNKSQFVPVIFESPCIYMKTYAPLW